MEVGAGDPFLIGSEKMVVAAGEFFFLTINDNLGPCDGSNRGSCYEGNLGSLSVTIATQ